jgi:DNA-binding NarL/FixJ family response regulator
MNTVIILEKHPLVSVGVGLIIKEHSPDVKIFEANSVTDFWLLAEIVNPDLVIMEINVPSARRQSFIRMIKNRFPEPSILICTDSEEKYFAMEYFKLGVDGFISKNTTESEFRYAVSTLLAGRTYMSEQIRKMLISKAPNQLGSFGFNESKLSNRENQVMQLLLKGKQTKEISLRLKITVSTVSTLKRKVFNKMGVDNIVQLLDNITKAASRSSV